MRAGRRPSSIRGASATPWGSSMRRFAAVAVDPLEFAPSQSVIHRGQSARRPREFAVPDCRFPATERDSDLRTLRLTRRAVRLHDCVIRAIVSYRSIAYELGDPAVGAGCMASPRFGRGLSVWPLYPRSGNPGRRWRSDSSRSELSAPQQAGQDRFARARTRPAQSATPNWYPALTGNTACTKVQGVDAVRCADPGLPALPEQLLAPGAIPIEVCAPPPPSLFIALKLAGPLGPCAARS